MRYPDLVSIPTTRKTTHVFGGLNRTPGCGEGELEQMCDLTSDGYPALSSRPGRGVYANPASPQGLIAKDELCYVDGSDFVLGQRRIPMGLSVAPEDCPKELHSMGAWVIILPDQMYINTADPEDFGPICQQVTTTAPTVVSLCRPDGRDYESYHLGSAPPESPQGGDLWLDTSQSPGRLKQYAADSGTWVSILTTCLRLASPGIGAPFQKGDGVTLSIAIEELEGANIIADRGEDFLLITGILPQAVTVETPVTVSRKMPKMDFLTQAGNRLWGCRYGPDDSGEFVNRIYASKLGDFRNWTVFQGLSTDAYYASVGSDGPFTGAVNYLGEALFFKENGIHRVWGSYPSEFRVLHTPCRGVAEGCGGSLAVVGDTLYYQGVGAVCAYDGSLPRVISEPLGEVTARRARAAALGSKLYLSLEGEGGQELLVYDTRRALWHRETGGHFSALCPHRGSLYAIDDDSHAILRLAGSGAVTEEQVQWLAQTGALGLDDPDRKYLTRLTLRMALEPGGEAWVEAEYDHSGIWEELAVLRGRELRSFALPVRPRRCDHLKLRLRGRGGFRLYSITKTLEGGSDIQW